MTTKILTGTYVSGYTLETPVTTLSIASTGYVQGAGIATPDTASAAYTVINDGRVAADDSAGVAGVYLASGGALTNGSAMDETASISGYRGVDIAGRSGTVTNFGTIVGDTRSGVWLSAGGLVTNGSAAYTGALIKGGGVAISIDMKGAVRNFGAIDGGVQFIYLASGGVTNGSDADTTALIWGAGSAVYFYKGKAQVANFGTIEGGSEAGSAGVFLGGGHSGLTNGSGDDTGALIAGYDGAFMGTSGRLANFGTIAATGDSIQAAGVSAGSGSVIANGSEGDTAASITGYDGVVLAGGGSLTNFGTVVGTGGRGQGRTGLVGPDLGSKLNHALDGAGQIMIHRRLG